LFLLRQQAEFRHVADVTAVTMAVFSLPNGGFNRDETLPPCRKQHMQSIGV
jgi:hypothetical protein